MENIQHFPTKEKLHTDVLSEKYGPIHADVLRHDNKREAVDGSECLREARLVDKENILRTYALTFLDFDPNNAELMKIDDEIRNGGLIGETFRKYGYTIKKNVVSVFLLKIPESMKTDFKVDADQAKSRITEFYAKKEGSDPVIYGTVLEVYSPDFRDPNEGLNDVDLDQVNPTIGDMQKVGIPTNEIWSRLDRAAEPDEWKDMEEKYKEAQGLSAPIVQTLLSKVADHINSK